MTKWSSTKNRLLFFLFLEYTDYSAHAGTKGDLSCDKTRGLNDMGMVAVSYTTYYMRPCFEPSVTTADYVPREKITKKIRDK